MDKPITLSVRDYVVRKLAPKMMIKEEIIDAVITHQFKSANEAILTNKSVEISGFGKFVFNEKKAVHKMNSYLIIKEAYEKILNDENTTEQKRKNTLKRMDSVLAEIDILKPRL